MTDLELLIRAARAIGASTYTGPDDCSESRVKFLNGTPTNYEGRGEWGYEWIPLKNDGEALRLAVELHIDLQFDQPLAVTAIAIHPRTFQACGTTQPFGDDKNAAVRRAIVVTAAALAD